MKNKRPDAVDMYIAELQMALTRVIVGKDDAETFDTGRYRRRLLRLINREKKKAYERGFKAGNDADRARARYGSNVE